MSASSLPAWAEDMLRRWGPQLPHGKASPNPAALARYEEMTARFRRRWHLELQPEVWALFGTNVVQSRHLFGLMIDLARYGSRAAMQGKRQALDDVERIENELRALADLVQRKIALRDGLLHVHGLDEGLGREVTEALGCAAAAVGMQVWREPRDGSADYDEIFSNRKTARDALNAMLYQLDRYAHLLQPVVLTDRARAAIFNVAHDTDVTEHYTPEAVKKARADLRRR